MSNSSPSIVWFRKDLRLGDHPALQAAIDRGQPLILLYMLEEDLARPHGGARKVWLHHSLKSLQADIDARGGRLILRQGQVDKVLNDLIEETGAGAVFWNRRYHGPDRDRDAAIKSDLNERGLQVESFKGNLLVEPWEVKTKSGGPYRVFTPFWRAAKEQLTVDDPIPTPETLNCIDGNVGSDALDNWKLLPNRPDWGSKMLDYHVPGEAGASERLSEFLAGPMEDYAEGRDRADKDLTSRLSPHLAHGEISPRQI
ncbi:MAG: deoxyribodipyrimidine photo-lyase, partial [Pseudomonadota bacterium]